MLCTHTHHCILSRADGDRLVSVFTNFTVGIVEGDPQPLHVHGKEIAVVNVDVGLEGGGGGTEMVKGRE